MEAAPLARALYRSRQVWHALRPKIDDTELASACALLNQDEARLFRQAEGVVIANRLKDLQPPRLIHRDAKLTQHLTGARMHRKNYRHLAPEPGRTPLAPWVLGIAFVPLAFILRRRNL